ncbi:MAG: glycosyltransferase family 39 protein [Planctomycetota bacterium]
MKKTILILVVLLTLAFAVRLAVAFNTYIISSDGPFYLNVAKDFAEGDYKQALTKQTFHQLYPFVIAAASKFISNLEWAGMLASIILSVLAVIPLYFIAGRYFAMPIVIISCLLYCFHPQGAQLSASIFTTGAHISILLFALWVTILALETGKNLYFILSGVLSFAMYLNRPDGLAFLGITLVGIMFLSRPNPAEAGTVSRSTAGGTNDHPVGQAAVSWKAKGIKAIYLLIPWLLLLPPYLLVVESATGVFGLTGKVSAEAVSHIGIIQSFDGLYQFIVDFIKGANPILFLLFLIGAIRQEKNAASGKTLLVWLVFAGFMVFFAVYAFTHGRMSKRYTVPLFLMMLPWTSAGLYYISEKISRPHTRKILYGLTIILALILSVFTFKPVGQDKLIEKNTGELLKKYHWSRSGAVNRPPVIITTLARIAYYAGGTNVMPENWDLSAPYGAQAGKDKLKISAPTPSDTGRSAREHRSGFLQSLKDTVRQKGVDYIVLDSRITRKFPDIEKEIILLLNGNIKVELISQYFGGYPPPGPTPDRRVVGVGNSDGDFYRAYQFVVY